MRRAIIFLLAATLACNTLTAPGRETPTPMTPPPAVHSPTAAAPAATATLPAPTATEAPPTLTATAVPSPEATATPEGAYSLSADNIRFHPYPRLYSGDIVSVEVIAEGAPEEWQDAPVTLYLGSREDPALAITRFGRFGIGGRAQATFVWVWDTAGLEGSHDLIVVVEPLAEEGAERPPAHELTVEVVLLPASDRPMPEREARWASAETDCCIFHYLTGTAAERDIDHLMAEAEAAFAHVEDVLGVERRDKVSFTLLSRLLGHGGFAAEEISLTYIDRNPADSEPFNLFAHEGTHILDRQFAQTKPAIMTEGLAVYVAGGHFKPEDLERRAAALLDLDWYIPLQELADNFYPAQHEIGYLQGGAFVHYLVERFGWPRFKEMYASFQSAPSPAQMLDAGLRQHFAQGLDELEQDWLAHLRTLPYDQDQVDDLRLTVALFDSLRAYQRELDPVAYFLHAWLPNGPEGRRRGIVGDFVRQPREAENIAHETMLAAAGAAMRAGDYAQADALLEAVNMALQAGGLWAHPLAAEHLQIVEELLAQGYEPQTISLEGNIAQVTAIRDWPELESLALMRMATGWQFSQAVPACLAAAWPLPINRPLPVYCDDA
jgi:hypothetical protein